MVIKIRLLTFNIHHGKGLDRKVNLQRISHVIKSVNADVIGINEVDKNFSNRSNYVDQTQWLADELQFHCVFGPAITITEKGKQGIRQYGNALLSRFPIIHTQNYPFDFLPSVIEDRALLETDIKIDSKRIRFFVTHLSFAPFIHKKQTEYIISKVKESKHMSVLLGDWNMRPHSKSWRKVTAQLKDANAGRGCNYTFPSRRPKLRLDYIFVSKDVNVLEAHPVTFDVSASDHLAYQAVIEI